MKTFDIKLRGRCFESYARFIFSSLRDCRQAWFQKYDLGFRTFQEYE
jgi:formylglycine-generating enzyme required for sulfatase activity